MGKPAARKRAKNDPQLLEWTSSELQSEVDHRWCEGLLSDEDADLCNALLDRADANEGDTSIYYARENYDDAREYDAYLNTVAYILARTGRCKVHHPNPNP